MGVSRCGKTSAFFDAARKSYCILITASNPQKPEGMTTFRDLGGLDASFTNLVGDLNAILNEDINNTEKNWKCDRALDAFVVTRTMILYAFHRKRVGINNDAPVLWLTYQLSAELVLMTRYLYQAPKKRKLDMLEKLRLEIETTLDFFFVFDRAREAYKVLDTGSWHSSKDSEKTRGMGSPFLRRLSLSNKCVVVTGTALSLGRCCFLQE